jgi:hypothetical protein
MDCASLPMGCVSLPVDCASLPVDCASLPIVRALIDVFRPHGRNVGCAARTKQPVPRMVRTALVAVANVYMSANPLKGSQPA